MRTNQFKLLILAVALLMPATIASADWLGDLLGDLAAALLKAKVAREAEMAPKPDPTPMPDPTPVPDPIEPEPMPEPLPPPDEPEPEPRPEPTPEPTPMPAYPEVLKAHPRLFWRDDTDARIAAAPDVWKRVVAAADSTMQTADRMLCRAARYRMGESAYCAPAVADLVALKFATGSGHYDIDHLQPVSIGYDWLYDAMTESERAAVRATVRAALSAAPKAGDLLWTGYNHDSGVGMTSALAIHGESEIDWVARYWRDNWWSGAPNGKTRGGLFNRAYERNVQRGGGTREGWSYLQDQAAVAAARGAWESATGDIESLDYPWLSRISYLILHQTHPIVQRDAKGREIGSRLFLLPAFGYGGEFLSGYGWGNLLAAGTGNRDPRIAALSAWLLASTIHQAGHTASESFVFRCLIGDPRIPAKSPEELGLPLDYTTEGSGYHYDRSDRGADATRVFFGCGETPERFFPKGDVMVWSKGRPLLGSRSAAYRHHYSGRQRMNCVLLYDKDGNDFAPTTGDSTPTRKPLAAFRVDGDSYVGELQGLYPPARCQLMRRSFRFDRQALTVAVIDEVQCASSLTPRIAWNTPEKPEVAGARITFTNGPAQCVMTFNVAPAEILVQGGDTPTPEKPFPWAALYTGRPRPQDLTDKTMFAEFTRLKREQQVQAGGFYTVYVTPPLDAASDTYRLTTTIQVLH